MTHAQFLSAEDAAAQIPDGATIAVTGSGGGLLEADAVFEAIEARFLRTGQPRDLTLIHALGIGDAEKRGLNRFAHEGLVKAVIGGHWSWSPRMQQLAQDGAIEAYTLPAGVIQTLFRESGAGRAGLFTHVGLGTFVDPRVGGGGANARSTRKLVEHMVLDGRELLHYKPFAVDVAIVRGTSADDVGNISLDEEAADLDAYAVALAAHNNDGLVIAQCRDRVARGTLAARSVQLPGVLIDSVVLVPEQEQTYLGGYDERISGRAHGVPATPGDDAAATGNAVRDAIARRAAEEARSGASMNFGFGIPGAIPGILAAAWDTPDFWVTVEQGIHNGELLDGALFGAARNADAIVPSNSQFDFYSGGGIDIAFLGMGEMDGHGNVNVSHLGGRLIGPGGFVDIAQNARTVVFCGTLEARATLSAADGRLTVEHHGSVQKLVSQVAAVTFSGEYARRFGQRVLYVTERAVFRLGDAGVELIEIAPGLDPERDVIERMGFRPRVASEPRTINPDYYREVRPADAVRA